MSIHVGRVAYGRLRAADVLSGKPKWLSLVGMETHLESFKSLVSFPLSTQDGTLEFAVNMKQ